MGEINLSHYYEGVGARILEKISNDLFEEVYCRKGELSKKLRTRLESLPWDIRKDVVGKTRRGCSPLFIACCANNFEAVEYLILECGADREQSGTYVSQWFETPREHIFTPLCCACADGNLPLVKSLVELGVDVNAVADCGSTPLMIACNLAHVQIVKYLVENGADIHKRNNSGQSCLTVSAHSTQLCDYLIRQGADVNDVKI